MSFLRPHVAKALAEVQGRNPVLNIKVDIKTHETN